MMHSGGTVRTTVRPRLMKKPQAACLSRHVDLRLRIKAIKRIPASPTYQLGRGGQVMALSRKCKMFLDALLYLQGSWAYDVLCSTWRCQLYVLERLREFSRLFLRLAGPSWLMRSNCATSSNSDIVVRRGVRKRLGYADACNWRHVPYLFGPGIRRFIV